METLRTTSLDLASYVLSKGARLLSSELIVGSTTAWIFEKTPQAINLFQVFSDRTGDGATIIAFQKTRRFLLQQIRLLSSQNGGDDRQ